MSDIPAESRAQVEARDLGLCVRCGHKGGDWHHRRTRSVPGAHQHCPCNGVTLCRSCHTWAHYHPEEAKDEGLIVSRFNEAPWMVPVRSFSGWFTVSCDGCAVYQADSLVTLDEHTPYVRPVWTSPCLEV